MDISKQKQKELEVEPWIPETPFRPITPKPPVIYTDNQGNQIGQANIPKLNGFSFGLSEDTHVAGMVECLHPANCNWQATLGGKKSSRNDSVEASRGCSIGNVAKWNNASSDDPLLALADAASKEHFHVGSNLHINSHHTPESKWGMFAPVTPEKRIRIEFKVAEMQNSYMYAIKNQETDEQNGIATTGADANRLQTEELHKQATNPSFAAISTMLKEHHNSEKAGSNAIDLNKTPQQKPRRKRHRPKVITEGKPKRTQKLATPNSAASTGNPTGKRKYVRKKAINKASTSPLAEATGESTGPKTIEPAKKSCRRALNFDIEGQPIEASSKCGLNVDLDSEPQPQVSMAENKSKSTVYLGHGIEVMVQNTQAGIAYDLACSVNQMLKDYVSLPEKEAASTPFPTQANQQQGKQDDNSQESHTKGKEVTAQNVPKQITALSPNCSSSTTSTEEGQSRVSKRTQFSPVVQPDSCSTNLIGIHYNALHAYQAMQFPIICKKKRTEKVQNSVSSSTSSSVTAAKDIVRVETTCRQKDPRGDPSTSKFNCWISTPQHKVNGLPDACGEERTDLLYKLQTFGSIIGQTARTRKKRSKGPTKVRDLASLTRIPMYTARQVENTHRPRTNVEALLAEMHGTWATKKRTKRVSVNSAFYSINAEPSHGKIILYNQNQFSTKSLDAHPEEIWKRMCSVDAIAEQLKHLNINKESNGIAFGEQNALVPYYFGNQMQNALVLYRRDGTIVPFDESFESIRKRRPRPKVDLDEETNRVWKLLMGNINSEGINGTDEEKEKWWEDERTVFCGRANSFIARMRLVQGDRRFSRWKGSVVDSVIGVFLTQNVSDHLSSSAFMSLAARFPLKSKNKPRCEERTSSVIEKPIVCVPDSKGMVIWNEISNQSLCDQSSMTVHDPEFDEEQEVVNGCESFGTSTGTISSESGPQMCCQSMARKTISETSITRRDNCVLEEKTDINDAISSQNSVISSQNSEDSPSAQATERKESCSEDNSENVNNGLKHHIFNDCISFVELLQKVGSPVQHELCSQGIGNQSSEQNSNKECNKMEGTSASDKQQNSPQKITESQVIDQVVSQSMELNEENAAPRKAKSRRVGKEIRDDVDWDDLRKQAEANAKRERTENTMDSLDYEAARCADVNEIAETIKERGMNNMLAGRMKDFLNRLVREHGSIDLEWLRDIPPDKAKEYLLSFRGLGLKSVECVRLLTLHHLAFPVDTNVGRIAVRLGWVPLQPLPESLQLHLLELYPVLESIQKYLWPRLCKLDQRTLYELHYQMITFGKVFCTKSKPNCNACPMRGECRHFASAFASARLALPGPEEKGIVSATENTTSPKPFVMADQLLLPLTLPQTTDQSEGSQQSIPNHLTESKSGVTDCEPIIEEPSSPEPVRTQVIEKDIEDAFCEDPDEIPTIKLNIKEFTETLQNYMQDNMELHEGEMSKALVALTAEAASIPAPKLKNVSRLRTEHEVYELPDSHPLLQGLHRREPDDPCSYLLAIWTPGETASSIQPPERRCSSQEYGKFCDEKTCFSCNSIREANSQIVRGTLLIPCRTAMRGSFPLNGTYFQVNEVFADHDSSLNPIDVPRAWLWKLPRRTVYFGTSIPTIFKGLTTEGIQHCFWRGYVCVRGFDQKTRAPRPLMARLHFPASKSTQTNKGGKGAQ